MKTKIFLLFLLGALTINAQLPIVVSILPQKTFTKAIGGDHVSVDVMVTPGNSPHTYEPKPSQMRSIAQAQLYLAIGVEFEKIWLRKFHNTNPKMTIVDVSRGITRRPMREKHTTGKIKALDPHIWTSPANVRILARNTLEALQKTDPDHAADYAKNYQKFLAQVDALDQQLHTLLDPLRGTGFMVQHPTWGYFADTYGLIQIPIQIAGKNPKPRDLVQLIRTARTQKVRAIFTQPETSDTIAKVLANELHIPIVRISPMAADWANNLLTLARAIRGQTEQP